MYLPTKGNVDQLIKPSELAVVVGGGASGLAAARLLKYMGAGVRLLDANPKGFSPEFSARAKELDIELIAGAHEPEHFKGAALVVPSPGVPLRVLEPLLQAAGNLPYVSELGLAAAFVHEPIIAVTGTSGKTTTVSLIAAMLEAGGQKVFLGGNIGTPLSEYILQREAGAAPADVLVLEVSSFQLQSTWNFKPQVAILLNLSENHLDQHRDMEEYKNSKLKIFAQQDAGDLAIFNAADKELAAEVISSAKKEFFVPSGNFAKTRLLGAHNQSNLAAAWLAAREFGISLEAAQGAAAAFEPLAHRLENLGEKNGVLYINDSKCTTIEALHVALESMERPVFLLTGGVFKGGDLAGMIPLLRDKVKAIALFGASRDKFEPAWREAAPLSWDPTLEAAVKRVSGLAQQGDAVLLSPATSSYDLYANYKARGNDFKRIVEALPGEKNV